MLPPLSLTVSEARRFHLRRVGLHQPFLNLGEALTHLGFVQIDPINVCGRMHDLILRNRINGYREGDLMRHLHGEGTGFPPEKRTALEHHLPTTGILVAFALDAWPHLQASMELRARRAGAWSGRLTPRERELARHILQEIAQRGPLSSDAIDDDRTARRVWGQATLAKATLQKLFFHGRVLISGRKAQRRVYDLPERVLPETLLRLPRPSAEDTARWWVLQLLRQRRLARLKREDLRLVEDQVQAVTVGESPLLYCLREDLGNLDEARYEEKLDDAPIAKLLAPLDPLIYDRTVTAGLWNFDYTWEVYVPAAKRKRGYYALPLLSGTEVVGYADLRADREAGHLTVVSRSVKKGHSSTVAIQELARFLGLRHP
ncbi:MAG TPA: crosslink repair DNA glycosylase YcaQ family protein [Opitutaceae bacterium]|nr:crosslink repair DNA glycosylase YcaQ family protein [Opitutaceae bacterium]